MDRRGSCRGTWRGDGAASDGAARELGARQAKRKQQRRGLELRVVRAPMGLLLTNRDKGSDVRERGKHGEGGRGAGEGTEELHSSGSKREEEALDRGGGVLWWLRIEELGLELWLVGGGMGGSRCGFSGVWRRLRGNKRPRF